MPCPWYLVAAGLILAVVGCSGGADGPDAAIELRADNGVPLCGKAVVYLNFDAVTIGKAATDDSRLNLTEAAEIPAEGLVIDAYASAPDRERLTRLIDDKLAVQRIPVVHTRPERGDYFMLVFVTEFLTGVQGGRSTTNCNHTNPNTIGFLNTNFFSLHGGLEYALHGALLMIGRAAGLDPVGKAEAAQNCMVNDDFLAACTFSSVPRTLGPCTEDAQKLPGPQDQAVVLASLACK
jgi:hypothetical protein